MNTKSGFDFISYVFCNMCTHFGVTFSHPQGKTHIFSNM